MFVDIKVVKTGLAVDFTGDGWRAMEKTIEVRNRLTHPKRREDIIVSDEDLADLVRANEWLLQARDMMDAVNQVLQRTVRLTARPKAS